jgi:hypothetical protein
MRPQLNALVSGIPSGRAEQAMPKRARNALLILVMIALVLWGVHVLREWIRSDSCMDRGGAWNASTDECLGAPQFAV